MSYENSHFTNLGQLKKLATRTKSELDAAKLRIKAIEDIEPEHNVIVGLQKNGTDLTPDANRKVNVEVPTKTSDLTNDSSWIDETTIDDKISAAVAGALIPGGSILFANLPALAKANCNHIYNIEDAFTTTADFVEGAGIDFPAGTNVAIINTGTASSPVYKYDTYTGTVDYSVFMRKQAGATQGNFAMFDANGQAVDAGVGESDFLKAEDIAGKADKVQNATNGHLAGIDANGNLTDSGVAAADVQQAIANPTSGHVVTVDANGKVQDSGTALSALLEGSAATDTEVDDMIADVFGAES